MDLFFSRSIFLYIAGFLVFGIIGLFFFFVQSQDSSFEQELATQMRRCVVDNGGNFNQASVRCLQNLARDVMSQSSLLEILQSLTTIHQRNTTNSMFSLYCHTFTHFLGQEAYAEMKSIPKVYEQCSSACDGGCWHGAIEGYFIEKQINLGELNQEQLQEEVAAICKKREDYPLATQYVQCVHGIGHAVMFITDGELFKSLELCDVLKEEYDRTQCYHGVFMENGGSATSVHPSRYISETDPLYPCVVVNAKYQWSCYFNKGPYVARITRGNWQPMIQLCSNVVTEDGRHACFFGLGETLVTLVGDPGIMKDRCGVIPDPILKDYCIRGVAIALMTMYAGDSSRVVEFCAFVDEENKRNCYLQFGFELKKWTQNVDEAQRVCTKAKESQYVPWCQKAIKSSDSS